MNEGTTLTFLVLLMMGTLGAPFWLGIALQFLIDWFDHFDL